MKWILFIVLAVYILLSSMNFYHNEIAVKQNDHNVIYLYSDKEIQLIPLELSEEWISQSANSQALARAILLKLTENNIDKMLHATIPATVTIRNYRVDKKHVTVDFNDSIFKLTQQQEMILKTSVIKSLTSFDAFDSVEFFFNGIPIKEGQQNIYGKFQKRDALLSYDEVVNRVSYKTVSLYYPNDKKDKLIQLYEEIPISPNKKVEEVIIETILNNSEHSIFPKNTKLLNVYTNEEICFVDLSSECQTNFLPNGISERIAVYSVVNSLTDLPNITHVQFLVDGQVAKTFQGNFSLNRLLIKNYALMDLNLSGE